MTFSELFKNFFTHKDFLPSADKIPGTLFTPLHFIVAALLLAAVIFFAIFLSKKSEKTIRIVFAVLWAILVILEPTKIIWETYTGASVRFEWGGVLPLYPCSIFMYAMPFAIWGKGRVRAAGCGYACTLGLLGAAKTFSTPPTYSRTIPPFLLRASTRFSTTARCFSACSQCSFRAIIHTRRQKSGMICLYPLCPRSAFRL